MFIYIITLIICLVQRTTSTAMPNVDLSITSVITIEGASCDGRLDTSISYAGDINGDGMDDLIVGAYLDSPLSRTNAGSVYTLFGPLTTGMDLTTITSSQGFKIIGAAAGDNLGNSVKNAGDVNADGIADIIIGAAYADPLGRIDAGCAYVIYGQKRAFSNIDLNALTPSQGFKIMGANAGDSLGVPVSNAGDFNNDGVDDILIGAPNADPLSRSNAGITYVIFGNPDDHSDIDLTTLTSTQGIKILGRAANDNSGISVSYAGDINNDNVADIIIGAYLADVPDSTPRIDAGMVYVIFGQTNIASDIDLASLSISQGLTIWGDKAGDNLGISVSHAGDYNSDGINDVVIGAYLADPQTRVDGGAVYIVFGSSSWTTLLDLGSITSSDTSQVIKLRAASDYDNFGRSVSYAGDINNDGIDDVFAGALFNDPSSLTDAGSTYLAYGASSGLINMAMNSFDSGSSRGFAIYGAAINDNFGLAASYAGNLNGQAANNLVVKAKKADGSGTVYLLSGETKYNYWDATQGAQCNAPLEVRKSSGLLYCDFPCSGTDYLYWNGSCLSTCDFPLIYETLMGKNLCKLRCSGTDYLFPNGTCSSLCNPPFESWTENHIKYCNDTVEVEAEEEEGEGEEEGEVEIPIETEVDVDVQVEDDTPMYIQVTDVVSSVNTKSQLGLSLLFVNNPSATITTGLLKMFLYMRYLNITTTPTLMRMYNNSDTSVDCLDIAPDMPKDLKNNYQYPPLDYQFNQYAVPASFLVNFWHACVSIGFLIAIFSILLVLDILRQRKSRTNFAWSLVAKARIVLQNFTLQQLYSSFGDAVLFTVFEIQSQLSTNVSFNMSFYLCLMWSLIGAIILIFHVLLIKRYQKVKRESQNLKNKKAIKDFMQKNAGFTFLFEEFQDNSFVTQSFLFIFIARAVISNIIISLMTDYPFFQITILTLSTVAMLAFLIAKRPYRKMADLLQEIALEILFLIVNLSLFILYFLDIDNASFGETQHYLGEIILYCDIVGYFVPIVFIGMRIALGFIRHHRKGWKGGFRALINELIDAFTSNPEVEEDEDEKKQIISEKPKVGKLSTKVFPINEANSLQISVISPKSQDLENSDTKYLLSTNTLAVAKINMLKRRTMTFLALHESNRESPSEKSKINDSTIDIGSTPSIFSQEAFNGVRDVRTSNARRVTRKLADRSDASIFPEKSGKGTSSEDEGTPQRDREKDSKILRKQRPFF